MAFENSILLTNIWEIELMCVICSPSRKRTEPWPTDTPSPMATARASTPMTIWPCHRPRRRQRQRRPHPRPTGAAPRRAMDMPMGWRTSTSRWPTAARTRGPTEDWATGMPPSCWTTPPRSWNSGRRRNNIGARRGGASAELRTRRGPVAPGASWKGAELQKSFP